MSSVESIAAPWLDGRPSIHRLVLDALAVRGPRENVSLDLDLELSPTRLGQLSFGPGAADSLIGQPDTSRRQTRARRLVVAIANVLRRPSADALAHLYELLRHGETITTVDAILVRLGNVLGERRPELAVLARRLIMEAPDVEPVKAGVALLGISGKADDAALVSVIGRYEEITIYSVVALRKLLADPEPAIWSLAKAVHGWGRIRAVPFLTATTNPDIRDWMLREGFRNGVMYEYLAYACALGGDLRAALAREQIDADLLVASAELLGALIMGGPAESIEDYADGAEVCVSFLRHAVREPVVSIRIVDTAIDIRNLGAEERTATLRKLPGWTARAFLEMRSLTHELLRRTDIRSMVEQGLASADVAAFDASARIASHFSIDSWPLRHERQRSSPADYQWYWLMQTDDPGRIEQVVALARAQLDLVSIASGPTTSIDLGSQYVDDCALNMVL